MPFQSFCSQNSCILRPDDDSMRSVRVNRTVKSMNQERVITEVEDCN